VDVVVAVIGTLVGTLIGVLGSYLTQRSHNAYESSERIATVRREVYVAYLSAGHALFMVLNPIIREAVADKWNQVNLQAELRAIDPAETQVCFESLRLVASQPVASKAASVQRCLRRHPAVLGYDISGAARRAWLDSYWQARRDLIDSVREELGFKRLDWSEAAVSLTRSEQLAPPGGK
jgi:hypothetical protein